MGKGRAVVLGGSMAGLLAARVLSESFDEVVVVERDVLPEGAAHRRGTPQDRHVHGLLAAGSEVLEELFPGIGAELRAAGCPDVDAVGASRFVLGGRRFAQHDIGRRSISTTRPFLEAEVRDRVRARGNVRFREGCDALGLATDVDRRTVTGVRVLARSFDSAAETIAADLVVDAMGRGSRTPTWLTDLGYPAPEVEEVGIGATYLTRRYRLRPGALDGDNLVIVAPTPATPRFGVLARQEDGDVTISMGGYFGQCPERDDAAYVEFARTLAVDDLAHVLAGAEPLTDFAPSRFPASRRRRYDRVAAFPEGLLVIGDAVAGFNPMYGQGMTVAALEALVLRTELGRGTNGLAGRYFRAVHRIEDVAWRLTTGADLRIPGVQGERSAAATRIHAWVDRIQQAAEADWRVAHGFLRVSGFLDPPSALFRPALVVRVLRANRRHRGAVAATRVPSVQAAGRLSA